MWVLFEDAIRRRGSDGLMLLSIICAPHAGKESRKVVSELRKLATFSLISGQVSVYEQVDDETRVLLIGSCLKVAGRAWLASHPRQAEWLQAQGIRPDEAIERHRAWLARREIQLAEKRANAE